MHSAVFSHMAAPTCNVLLAPFSPFRSDPPSSLSSHLQGDLELPSQYQSSLILLFLNPCGSHSPQHIIQCLITPPFCVYQLCPPITTWPCAQLRLLLFSHPFFVCHKSLHKQLTLHHAWKHMVKQTIPLKAKERDNLM